MDELIKTVKSGSYIKVKKFLEKYIKNHGRENLAKEINTVYKDERYTALYWASFKGCIDIVKLLIYYGASPSLTIHTGETPLTVAKSRSNQDIAILLQTECDKESDLKFLEIVEFNLNKSSSDIKLAYEAYGSIKNKAIAEDKGLNIFFKAINLISSDIVSAVELLQEAAKNKCFPAWSKLLELAKSENNSLQSSIALIALYSISKEEIYAVKLNSNPLWQEYFNGICALNAWREYKQVDFVAATNSFYNAAKQGLLLANIRLAECLIYYPTRFNVSERMRKTGELSGHSTRPDANYVLNKAMAYIKDKILQPAKIPGAHEKLKAPLTGIDRQRVDFLFANIKIQKASTDPIVNSTLADNLYSYAQLIREINIVEAINCYKQAVELKHVDSMIALAEIYYYGLHDGSHLPLITESIFIYQTAISTLIANARIDEAEKCLEKLTNLRVLALEVGRASIDSFIVEARKQTIDVYKKIIEESLQGSRYTRASVCLDKLLQLPFLSDHDHQFISQMRRRVRPHLYKLEIKNLADKSVPVLVELLKNGSVFEKLAAEKKLIELMKKGQRQVTPHLIQYYEDEAHQYEEKRNRLLKSQSSEDDRRMAYACQLNMIRQLQLAAELGSPQAEELLKKHTLFGTTDKSVLTRVTSDANTNIDGNQACVDFAKYALYSLNKLDEKDYPQPVVSVMLQQKAEPSAPPLSPGAASTPEGYQQRSPIHVLGMLAVKRADKSGNSEQREGELSPVARP